LVEFMDELVPL